MRSKIYVPPLSDRTETGFQTKNEWLVEYYQFRNYHKNPNSLKQEAQEFQASMGKNSSELANRFRGSFLGLAVGDALGTTLEFTERNTEEIHREMVGKGPFNLKPGQWTDDTSMALCVAYSLFDQKRFNANDQMELFCEWWRDGLFSSTGKCFDIGNTVSSALMRFKETGDAFAGSSEEMSAGNGSLMRLAPTVLFFASDPGEAILQSGESSRLTHGNIQSIDACRYYAALILGAIYGVNKNELLSPQYAPIEEYWSYHPLCKKIQDVANGSFKEKSRLEIESTGYVIHSLEAALWAFYNSDSFESGLIKAVNLGGDSDTIGAIYGQLAGAYYGELNIPFKWIKDLTRFHYFYYFSDEFASYYSGRQVK